MNASSGNVITSTAQIVDGIIVNADINASAAIAWSKIASALAIGNADIATNAAIAYSKLALAVSIVNGDIATNAAIALSKFAAGTQGGVMIAGASGVWQDIGAGTSGQFLKSAGPGANAVWGAGSGMLGWGSATTGSNVQATFDLLLVVKTNGAVTIKSDSTATPTTERVSVSASTAPECAICPVMKNDYYNIGGTVSYAYYMQMGA